MNLIQKEYFIQLEEFQKANIAQKDINMSLFNILIDMIESRNVSSQKFVEKVIDFVKKLLSTA